MTSLIMIKRFLEFSCFLKKKLTSFMNAPIEKAKCDINHNCVIEGQSLVSKQTNEAQKADIVKDRRRGL